MLCMYVPYIPCISGFYHEIIYIFLPTEIVPRMRIQLYDRPGDNGPGDLLALYS